MGREYSQCGIIVFFVFIRSFPNLFLLLEGRECAVLSYSVRREANADLACAISSASGKWQPMTTQIQNCRSFKFALGLNTRNGSGNLIEVNEIAALIGHHACAV